MGGFVRRRAAVRHLLRPVGVDPRLQGRVRAPSLQLHVMLMRRVCLSEGRCISYSLSDKRRQEWKRETCFRETCFFVWWCRWQQKGLDPKYYHTEPDGSNWVYSFASQSLLSAGLPAHSAYEAAPWELDPSYLSQGIPSFPSPPLAGPPPPRPGACAHAQRSLGGITSCSAH